MLKTRRALCLILACVIMLLACIAGIVSFNSVNNTSSQKFQADLKGLYSTYDADVDYDSITSRLELKRLIVSNYDGKDYGCVSKAVDKKNGIAVLQFDSTDAVKDAYKKAVKGNHYGREEEIYQCESCEDCPYHEKGGSDFAAAY